MCGRYSLSLSAEEVERLVSQCIPIDDVLNQSSFNPRRNIGPTTFNPVYTIEGDRHVLECMQWGLVPHFAKEHLKLSTFNCRSEGLYEKKPVWSCAKTKRAIVFMEGYYEWHHSDSKTKIPYYIKSKDSKILCALAVWDSNEHLGNSGEPLHSYSIVTTKASKRLSSIHPRMPAFIPIENAQKWIEGEWPSVLELVSSEDKHLEFYKVSTEVNKISNESEDLNLPVSTKAKSFFVPKTRSEKPIKQEAEPARDSNVKETKSNPNEHQPKLKELISANLGHQDGQENQTDISDTKRGVSDSEDTQPEGNKRRKLRSPK